ncbi:titin homolog isoform X2 [Poeciliopsis prolifica]|uniref:titin homolog isoform X2 n=1 Tax=Poeciliopsis prolifica TaxID=188132 RepID=UPI0024136DFF|nr:titin homolog isoform X2 [Poeciliopsis prolifica]
MAAQVEVQTGEVGGTGAGGRLHLSPLSDASNTNVIEMSSIAMESNKPAPNPKPRLTPKPFAVEKNPTIKPILAPKPQTKPRPEPTRISGSKPDLPNTPKPSARLVSTNPNRPAATSFRTPNSLKTGQTTKPVIQPFKPVPPLDPVEPIKSSRPIPIGRQKPAASNLAYSKSLKTYSAAEWSGNTSVKNVSGESKEGSMTRAKSMEFLAAVGQDEEAKNKSPEAVVQLRTQPRRPRPVSAIFSAAPAKTETPVPAPRWVARRPLSADLTSKFETIGLPLHQKSPKANTPPDQNQEEEKSPPSTISDSADGIAEQTHSEQNAEETAAKDGAAADPPSPVLPVPDSESSVGVKQLIKQLTVDTTPSPIPAVKPVLKPRPLPLDLTKKFSSERSPDPEAADRHDISKESQRGAEESTTTPNDHKTFLDFKGSPLESRKGLSPQGLEAGLLWAQPKESGSGAELHTVRASLFENIVDRQSVFMIDQDESPKDGGVFFRRGNEEEDDGSLVTATYREPMSPSDPFRVSHTFDTVQATEENRAVSESIPAAQWEDKAMTLRTRRSERARPAVQMADPPPRYLRVGALHKWTTASFDQGEGSHKEIPQELESEGQAGLEKDQDVAAPKRLKMLQGEEPQKPKATYFALTGQMQDTASPGGVGSSVAGANLHFNDLSVRSAMGGSQGQIYSVRRNPSLEKAFGQISPTQETFDEPMQRNTVPSMEISSQMEEQTKEDAVEIKKTKEQQERERHLAKMNDHEEQAQVDFEKMKELERQREFERQRQKAFEKEKRELEEKRQRQKLEMEKQKRQEMERQRQLQKEKREQERQKKMEREYEKEKQKEMEMQQLIELERQSLGEKAEKDAEKLRQTELEQEMLQMKELEKRATQKEREVEMERKRELEKQRQREMEKEKRQQDLERQQLEKERLRKEQENERKRKEEKLKEMERQQLVELENQRSRERAEKEAERLRLMALEQESLRTRELEKEKERQRELEIQMEKERELEKQRQKQLDMEREQLENERLKREQEQERKRKEEFLKEMEKQRLKEKEEKEAEKLRQMALEQEMLRMKELEKERAKQRELELERQMEIETREREKRRQREAEKEKQRQLDFERQQFEIERLRREQEKDRQRKELELEKHKEKEKLEKAEAEKMRHIAKQQESERQRLKEKQKKEEQERLWLESSALRPKVLDLDSVLRSDPLSPASPQHSDASPRWREPYKPGILDIDSFTTQSSQSKDSLPVSGITGLDAEFGVWLQPTPERDVTWKVPAQTSGGFSSPVWTTSPQDPWELRPVEMSVDKPVMEPKRASNKLSPEQLFLKQEERHPSPQRHRPAFLDEPLSLSPLSGKEPQTRDSPHELSHNNLGEQIWIPREPQPPKERRDAHGHRRSHGSQELNRMRSRSMSRRSAPSSSAVEGGLLRMRSRSAHRELDHHSSVQNKQSSEADSGTPVRDTDSQYGTWETGLRTDDSLTPATPSSESNLSPSPRKPTPLPSPGGQTSQSETTTTTTDGPSPSSSSEIQPLDFPDAPTTLLDNSALRSRVQLGKKRAQRVRPSKAARPSAASAQGDGGDADSWLYRDSTEGKAESKNDDSESEEPAKGAEAGPAGPPQPQRVALFPGLDPSALKAQLKKRAESDNQSDSPAPSPSQQSRSPKSPFLPRAARVLPPPGGKENGQEDSPQWLKELKSKKRLSHYENES